MFLVPLNAPGITMRRITEVNGNEEFCEEFFDNLELGDDAVVGEVNNGWTVASRQLFHERRAVGRVQGSPAGSAPRTPTMPPDHIGLAGPPDRATTPGYRTTAGRALVRRAVKHLIDHVARAIADGSLPPNAGTIIRLFHAETTELEVDTALAIAGTAGVVDEAQASTSEALSVPADRFARRRQLGDGAQCDRRTHPGLPAGVRRRPRRAVQPGQARPPVASRRDSREAFTC